MIVLEIQGLAIGYKSARRPVHVVADDISVTLKTGELVCLLGPNGAGKSTLMRTLAGMQPPLSGQVHLMGKPLEDLKPNELARCLAIVLTERVEAGHLSAYELVALGRYPYTDWSGRLTETDESVVRWAIEMVGAKPLAQRLVSELSDGERQKVMVARALAQEPDLMLLDEPTAFLDLPRRVEMMQTLRKLARETGRAVLLSSHDLDLALRSADKLWLLSSKGKFQVGAPEDLVLSGAFEAVFQSEGVEFDRTTGTFRVHTHHAGQIILNGEGLRLVWTRRALEREGFQVVEDDSSLPCIEILETGWRLIQAGQPENFSSLYELIAALRKIDLLARV